MERLQLSDFRQTYQRFFAYARPDVGYLALALMAIIALTATNAVMVWLIGVPFDHLHEGRFDAVKEVLLWLVLLVVLNQLLHLVSTVMANWLGLRFVGRLRQALLGRLLHVSVPGSSQLQRGDLLARLSHDVDQVQDMILELPLFLVSHLLTLLFYGAMLFWIDWTLAMAALLVVPILLLHQRIFVPRKRRASEKFFHHNGELLAFEEQVVSNLRGICSVGAEARMENQHETAFERARGWAMRMRWLDQGFDVSLSGLDYFCGIVIVLLGIERIEAGVLQIGALVSFLIYLGYLSVPLRGFAQAPLQWQGAVGAAQRVQMLLELQAETQNRSNAGNMQVTRGDIRIQNVSFAYHEDVPVLSNVDLHIQGGETIALVGPSGAGKSTLARLLMRFHDPQQGEIYIDGCDLRDVTLESLREQFAVIWQEPFILNDTVRANLLLARPQATDEAVIDACMASGAWSFISELSDGLDTQIGSGGVELSGGQYQRIAIAQAMLRNAPFLILDEATSALDSQAERGVVEALDELRRGRTTLVIAHRFSSICNADRVVYFNGDGSVIVGTHDYLYSYHVPYRTAVTWQTDTAS